MSSKRKEREEYTGKVIKRIEEELKKHNVNGEVTGRPKHLYSIYKKIHEKGKKFTDLYDLIAMRIIVDKEEECYNILGIIHNLFYSGYGKVQGLYCCTENKWIPVNSHYCHRA